jgi:hypothetical protein
MDQACYKCGQMVEEGVPFCPHCSAPQIRVIMAEPPAQPVLATDPASAIPSPPAGASIVLPMAWSAAFRPCALAAVVASLLMSLGLNPFVAMLSVGFLAVAFYRHRWRGSAIKPAAGARLGALSGLLWFAISSILETTAVLFLHKGPEIQQELLKRIDQAASQTSDPQALVILDRFKTAAGLEFLMVFGIIFALLAAIALAVIGGALGGALLGRDNNRN